MKIGLKIMVGLLLFISAQKAAAAAWAAAGMPIAASTSTSVSLLPIPDMAGFAPSTAAPSRRVPAMTRHGLVRNTETAQLDGVASSSTNGQKYRRADSGNRISAQRQLDFEPLPGAAAADVTMLAALQKTYRAHGRSIYSDGRDIRLAQRAQSMISGSEAGTAEAAQFLALQKQHQQAMVAQFFPQAVATPRGESIKARPQRLVEGRLLRGVSNRRKQEVDENSFGRTMN